MEIAGSTILVTGASTGIGADLAVTLARGGATIGLVARRAELLEEVTAACREHSPDSRYWALDLADLDAAQALALEAWDTFGHLDALVNNAAIPKRRHATALTAYDVEHTAAVNYFAPVRMTLAVLPRMLERGRGVVVNVGSMAGRIGPPKEAAYSGSKFALSGFTEALAVDLWDTPVTVCLVQPGPIDTPIWDMADNEDPDYRGPKFPPSVVSDAIVEALTTETGFERFAPADFGPVVEYKTANIDQFLEGNAAFARGDFSTD